MIIVPVKAGFCTIARAEAGLAVASFLSARRVTLAPMCTRCPEITESVNCFRIAACDLPPALNLNEAHHGALSPRTRERSGHRN